jgi:hypothetical protein
LITHFKDFHPKCKAISAISIILIKEKNNCKGIKVFKKFIVFDSVVPIPDRDVSKEERVSPANSVGKIDSKVCCITKIIKLIK